MWICICEYVKSLLMSSSKSSADDAWLVLLKIQNSLNTHNTSCFIIVIVINDIFNVA